MIDALREIQERYGYLPQEELRKLSKESGVPVSEIFGVASFYPHFHLDLPPRLRIGYCADMSCRLAGCQSFKDGIAEWLQGKRIRDARLYPVSCLGQCDRGPAISVNDHVYAGDKTRQVISLLSDYASGRRHPPQRFGPGAEAYRCDPYLDSPRYRGLARLLETKDWTAALETIRAAGLRGMGGSGFPTAAKWDMVRQAQSDQKYVVCNADESEVGTIKDREILKDLPHLVIEGMVVAGVITGATRGVVYLRHEYEQQRECLAAEIRAATGLGVLGKDVLGSGLRFDLEVFVSPGGYICGEESALLEALEGKRAQPRNKPPFPSIRGLWNKPTVINNVETFAYVPSILNNGPEWFASQGVNGKQGLKFVAVTGNVNRPGVFEVPLGTRIVELIEDFAGGVSGGRRLKAFAPSGASSGFLPASSAELALDFESLKKAGSMMGSGAIIVLAEGVCLLDMALNATRFLRNESCGKCVPCRIGSQKLVDLLYGITRGEANWDDLQSVQQLSETLMLTSICGLGQVVASPIQSVMLHFPEEIEDHLLRRKCPSGVCYTSS